MSFLAMHVSLSVMSSNIVTWLRNVRVRTKLGRLILILAEIREVVVLARLAQGCSCPVMMVLSVELVGNMGM